MWAHTNSNICKLLHLSSLTLYCAYFVLYPVSVMLFCIKLISRSLYAFLPGPMNPGGSEHSHKDDESDILTPYILYFTELEHFYLSTIKCL